MNFQIYFYKKAEKVHIIISDPDSKLQLFTRSPEQVKILLVPCLCHWDHCDPLTHAVWQ